MVTIERAAAAGGGQPPKTSAQPPAVLTIDGPSGSGKGTLAQRVAQALGWHLLDSGAIYRVLAYRAIRENVALDDVAALLRCIDEMTLRFGADGQLPVPVCLDGQWITSELRTEIVGRAASQVAAHGPVRAALLDRQREFRQLPGLVADGRDMGTVVFPDAQFKVFLTASAEARAERRLLQLQSSGVCDVDAATVLAQIKARDEQDMKRPVAPLKPAPDAIEIDSTVLDSDAVFDQVMALVTSKITAK